MATKKKNQPPSWLYLFLAVGSLLASGIYIGIMGRAGFTTWDFIRAVIFGALGILWLFMSRNIKDNKELTEHQ